MMSPQLPVCSGTDHFSVAFFDQRTVPKPSLRPREGGYTRQFATDGQSGAIQETARNLAESGLAADGTGQFRREAFFGKAPQVGELGFIDHICWYDDHRGLKFVEG